MSATMFAGLPIEACEKFAQMSVQEELRLLRTTSVLGTGTEDKVLAFLAGHYHDQYLALVAALEEYDK